MKRVNKINGFPYFYIVVTTLVKLRKMGRIDIFLFRKVLVCKEKLTRIIRRLYNDRSYTEIKR